ncbi:nucleotidyltransferase family protein [Virgibacillus byunsanensis]|uniref:Nucleotidyltransferase family protein n=1 Tax=Virgibacillus byunsanensis TaxID=570945 RepID=A0ABW3LSY7_9BACI
MPNEFNLNLTNIPRELRLIIELLKNKSATQLHTNNPELFNDIDWNSFIDLTMHHRVYPVLFSKLKETCDDVIPYSIIKSLSQQYKKNTFQMLHLSGEMERVSKLFSIQEIPLLFLKGPVLAQELYGDISLRTSSDLDMLIPIDQLEKAEAVLVEQGYEKDDYIQTVLNDWKWRHHHVTFFHRQKQIKVEVHWRLNPGPAKEPSFHALWQRKTQSSLTSFPVYLLGKEDLFLFLVSHGSRHGWSRLRWLMDIYQLIKTEIDWKETNGLLRKYGYHRAGGQGLILASKLLGKKTNKEIISLTTKKSTNRLAQQAVFYLERKVNLHTDPVPETIARYHKRHLFSLMSTQQKFMFMVSFLHPYPEDAETLALPKLFHFLYFPLRPLLWAWRKTRKHALS